MKKSLMVALMVATTAPIALLSPVPAIAADKDIVVIGQGRVATEVFGRKPNMQNPQISPDGTKIAYKAVRGSKDYIVYIDMSKKPIKPKVIVAATEVVDAGDRTVAGWRWVGNNKLILTMRSRDIFFGERGDVSRLVAYDLSTKKLTTLAWDGAAGNGGSVRHIDHDNEEMTVQRSSLKNRGRSEVIKIDVNTGKYKMVQRSNTVISGYATDSKGVVRAAFGSNSSGQQRVLYRSDGKGNLKTVSKAVDKDFTGEGVIFPQVFLSEPDMAYAMSRNSGFNKLYKVNMKTGEESEPVFEKEGYDVQGLITNYDDTDVVGVRVFNGRTYSHYFEPKRKAVQKFLDESFGKYNARLQSIDRDFKKLIVHVGKPSQRGAFYLYDLESGKFSRLGWVSNKLKDAELNPMGAVDYTASDGMKIQAIMTYPRHRKTRKNLPVIVMPHGGPFGAKDDIRFGYFPWTQAMAELGYVVIQPNYRGSGGYGSEFEKEGRKPNGYGGRMQDDLNDAVTYFAEKGLVDKNRACIMGWSYGGYATARGAQRDPEVWRCAIAGAGVYDFPMMKAYDTRTFGSFGASYQATADDLVEISSARNTKGKWSPIMIASGLRDARIPIEQARVLVSRLKSSGKVEGKDFKYIENKKGTHNLPFEQQHVEWLVEAEKWLAMHNPAYIDTDPDKPLPVSVTSK
ncbi:MAG: prolyl oligopeptidase family serine peptidase [Sphingorhabdus sp.]